LAIASLSASCSGASWLKGVSSNSGETEIKGIFNLASNSWRYFELEARISEAGAVVIVFGLDIDGERENTLLSLASLLKSLRPVASLQQVASSL
jgi:hypothetical protein